MTAQELTILIPWLVTGIVGIGSIFKYFLDLRSNNDYRAAQERIVVAKDAQIAEAQETGKSKNAHIALLQETLRSSQTAAEERLKAKDDRIEHLKSQSAPTALSVLNAQQELRDRVITDLQTQLADSQGSHARSEQDIEDLRDQLSLAQTTLAA